MAFADELDGTRQGLDGVNCHASSDSVREAVSDYWLFRGRLRRVTGDECTARGVALFHRILPARADSLHGYACVVASSL